MVSAFDSWIQVTLFKIVNVHQANYGKFFISNEMVFDVLRKLKKDNGPNFRQANTEFRFILISS